MSYWKLSKCLTLMGMVRYESYHNLIMSKGIFISEIDNYGSIHGSKVQSYYIDYNQRVRKSPRET